MTYPKHLLTPLFNKGDILTYEFEGAALNIRLPIIPLNNKRLDRTFNGSNLTSQDTSLWDSADNIAYIEFAKQAWTLEDSRNMDDIASCIMDMTLVENSEQQRRDHTMLNQSSFEARVLSELTEYHEEPSGEFDPNWPRPDNNFSSKIIRKNHLDWFQYEYCAVEGRQTSPIIIIPIDNRFTLTVSLSLTPLHGPGRANPFSDEVLRQVSFDLFDELLENINLQYTPETIALIVAESEKLKHS